MSNGHKDGTVRVVFPELGASQVGVGPQDDETFTLWLLVVPVMMELSRSCY